MRFLIFFAFRYNIINLPAHLWDCQLRQSPQDLLTGFLLFAHMPNLYFIFLCHSAPSFFMLEEPMVVETRESRYVDLIFSARQTTVMRIIGEIHDRVEMTSWSSHSFFEPFGSKFFCAILGWLPGNPINKCSGGEIGIYQCLLERTLLIVKAGMWLLLLAETVIYAEINLNNWQHDGCKGAQLYTWW